MKKDFNRLVAKTQCGRLMAIANYGGQFVIDAPVAEQQRAGSGHRDVQRAGERAGGGGEAFDRRDYDDFALVTFVGMSRGCQERSGAAIERTTGLKR